MRLKINGLYIFEWISYNEFTIIKDLEKHTTLAIWEKGPLYYNTGDKKWVRNPREKVYLKYLYSLQEITEITNEVFNIFNIFKSNIINIMLIFFHILIG